MRGSGPRGRPAPFLHLALLWVITLTVGLWRGLHGDPVTDALEDRLLDLRFQLRGAAEAPDEVVLVAIDEATIDRLGWSPPPRWALADGVERIIEAGARVVALDLLLLDQTAAGPALAATLAGTDRVVLAAAVTNEDAPDAGHLPAELQAALARSGFPLILGDLSAGGGQRPPRLLLPRAEMVGGASLAHVNVVRSADRVVRKVPLGQWIGGDIVLPAMALEVARRMMRVERGGVALSLGQSVQLGGRRIATDRAGSVTINHYGGRGTISSVSLADVLDGKVAPETFSGRAVFVGATAESLSDLFATPFAADVPGVEVIAALTANLLEDKLVEAGNPVRLGATLALALLLTSAVFLAARQRPASLCYLGTGFAWIAGAAAVQFAFSWQNAQLDAVSVLAALVLATAWMSVQRFRSESAVAARADRERENLSRFVPPLLADRLASGEVGDLDRRNQDAAILFVDVAGFTARVQNLPPERTAVFLRDLHRMFDRCAAAHGGVIAGFEGDGAMIVFGLPEVRAGDAAAAVDCGAELLSEAGRFRSEAAGHGALRLRVSVHFGSVAAAILGSDRQAQVTVTGDAVNLASRLQEVAKEQGAEFVVSRAALDAAVAGGCEVAPRFRPLNEAAVRGRSGRVEVWGM